VTDPTRRADYKRLVVKSPGMVQLARERLRRSFDESRDTDRVYDNVITHRDRSEARAGGSDDVMKGYSPPRKRYTPAQEMVTTRPGNVKAAEKSKTAFHRGTATAVVRHGVDGVVSRAGGRRPCDAVRRPI